MSETSDRVIALVRDVLTPDAAIAANLSNEQFEKLRLDELDLDSLGKMELVMQIEDTLGVSLDEEDMIACVTVSDLVALVKRPT